MAHALVDSTLKRFVSATKDSVEVSIDGTLGFMFSRMLLILLNTAANITKYNDTGFSILRGLFVLAAQHYYVFWGYQNT